MLLPRLTALLACCFLTLTAGAQDRLLAPSEFLGYELGSRFTPHHRVIDYVEHVAAHSPNVQLESYGETYEGRPLLVVYITTPSNLSRLEEIRTNNLKAAGLLPGAPTGRTAAVVWLSYNVHGNEAVSTEAALATLYDLADPANARTQAWLQNTVVLLDPLLNPDGRERYVQWYNRTVGRTPNPNPDAREHHEPWPGGRTNHYYFDLNRDWAWQVQQETQQRVALYNRWMPHVHVDFHEQGVDEPYYFAPAAEPFHERITPWQRAFQTTIGRNHARYFDAAGWLYFTRQRFDLFYPSYGDTWPTFNGAIGMTYEQGGSGRAGLAVRTAEGDTLTLRDRIDHHHTTGLSTIEAVAQNSERVREEFKAYFNSGQTAPGGPYRTYVVKAGDEPEKLDALAAYLERQDLRFGYADRSIRTRGLRYADGRTGSLTVEPGDLVVSRYQPKSVLASVLFEPRSTLVDSLTYDITAWSLPYAYGLEAYAVPDRIEASSRTADRPPPAPGSTLLQPYAYLARWKTPEDLKLLSALLQEDVRVRFAEKAFSIDGQQFEPGTLILTRAGNGHLGAEFDRRVRAAAAALGQPLHPVATGFVSRGADFGSSDVHHLAPPRVAVLAGEHISPYALGEIWHFFDRQIGYPVTLLPVEALGDIRLAEYDVLILPGGSYQPWLEEARLDEIKRWVRAGGRLIAMEGAVAFLAGKEGFHVQHKAAPAAPDSLAAPLRTYAERERAAISGEVPGAIFRVEMDNTHPLGFGYDEVYYSLKRDDEAYRFLEEGWNVGVLRSDALVSGFAGHRAGEKLTDVLTFGVQDMGEGTVVYLVDNPLFRGFWYNGKLLFGNAVFLVGQ